MSIDIISKDHVLGHLNAPVVLIEYADFQCPYCKRAYHILREAKRIMGDRLAIVFRHFPLQELHANAVHAAIAAETAGGQGKFWEMHDALFEHQDCLEDICLIEYAGKIGLDVKRFEKRFGEDPYFHKVNRDYESGLHNGVDSTPTFFLNGKKYEGNWMSVSFIDHLQELAEQHLSVTK
ncbi:protein-disulfide isomerase [Parabacteroides sp. PFB2-10]|uniref:DsbA family protein n=1 Tax=Parabacteroides sp. PFB2-10 TaxID=1742405 RepID=UPI0024756E31|nr:DsbA family protein [Parabacteroides sp. PFB2-10]MDH6313554.1 protein-disulfide isomerase [Parabacteroides sp. PFB2-10]